MKRFENKIVLVVGGTAGIGKAIVERFISEGASVAFTDITDTGYEQSKAYNAEGGITLYIKADATNEEEVNASVKMAVQQFGKIDIAINNVGGQAKEDPSNVPLHETTSEGWAKTQALTELTAYLYMKAEIEQMLSQGGGVIANTVSMAGVKPQPLQGASGAYSASKAGVVHLTKYAAVQYAKKNIRVNAVAPGLVLTQKMKDIIPAYQQKFIVENSIPNGTAIEPEEIAAAFAFLCSDDARSVTGVVLPVDGGLSAT